MKKLLILSITPIFLILHQGHAQPPIKVRNGLIYMDDGTLTPNQKQYPELTDKLDKTLKSNPNDTVTLFYRSVLLIRYNGMIAKPSQIDQNAYKNLLYAASLVHRGDSLNMKSFEFKVLRAEVYREICYRYLGDQSWKVNASQASLRRKEFNNYKDLANRYYDELANLDKDDAYTFNKLKVTSNYSIK